MALPEPKPGETTVEIDRDLEKLLKEALAAVKAWTERVEHLKKKLQAAMGDATAATVDGRLKYTWRHKDTWREKDLIKDYPDLTQHYLSLKEVPVFDVKRFAEVHPEIAKQYQTRSFNEVK